MGKMGILHMGTKVVYTFWRTVFRNPIESIQVLFPYADALEEIIWLKQKSRDLFLLPHQREVRSSLCFVSSPSIFP